MLREKIVNWFLDRIAPIDTTIKDISDADLAKYEDPKRGVITIRDDAVEVIYPKPHLPVSVPWGDIVEIVAYKRDLFTVDQICLALCVPDDSPVAYPNEEMQGFTALRTELARRFPGYKEAFTTWLMESPTFDEESTSLWKRGA